MMHIDGPGWTCQSGSLLHLAQILWGLACASCCCSCKTKDNRRLLPLSRLRTFCLTYLVSFVIIKDVIAFCSTNSQMFTLTRKLQKSMSKRRELTIMSSLILKVLTKEQGSVSFFLCRPVICPARDLVKYSSSIPVLVTKMSCPVSLMKWPPFVNQ